MQWSNRSFISFSLGCLAFFLVSLFIYLMQSCVSVKETPEVKKPKECPSDFHIFKKVYWPYFLQNECRAGKTDKCCHSDSNDIGGLTCYGVAIEYNHSFYEYLDSIGYPVGSDLIDSKPVEPYAQLKIYMRYFKKPKIDKLPMNLREPAFDFSVHAGPTRAIRVLQRLCGVKSDGHIGANTIAGCKRLQVTADQYIEARRKWLSTRPSWKIYKKGFENRLKRQAKQSKLSFDLENKTRRSLCAKHSKR